jgi:hypothetical protein
MNTETSLSKCPCQNCSGHIEFDPAAVGQSITCPHCGVDTVLFVPGRKKETPAPLPKAEPPPLPAPPVVPSKIRPSIIGPVVLFLIGLALVVGGCGEEALSCTGLILIGLALLLDMLRIIARNQ